MMRAFIASLAATVVLLATGLTAQAGMINTDLGNSGWQVSSPSDDVFLVVDGEGVETDGTRYVVIEIIKIFRDVQTPIDLVFAQTGGVDTTAERIYIADESITNLTGVDWTDFHWTVSSTDTAVFNHDLTNPTTDAQSGGFLISPFTESEWSSDSSSETLSLYGGTVASGGAFFPGIGVGNLVIDVVGLSPTGQATFTLTEIPTIPEPASLMLISLGSLAVMRPKHRRARA